MVATALMSIASPHSPALSLGMFCLSRPQSHATRLSMLISGWQLRSEVACVQIQGGVGAPAAAADLLGVVAAHLLVDAGRTHVHGLLDPAPHLGEALQVLQFVA